MIPDCGHPDPALCTRLGRHLDAYLLNLYRTNPAYHEKWEREAMGKVAPAIQVPSLPCIHLGKTLLATDGRKWSECEHPAKWLGNSVCSCSGCGPNCLGYDGDPAPFPAKPWEWLLTVAVPHLDTFDQLALGLALWRRQTVRPYLLVVDTGSSPEVCARLEKLRGEDCEIHFLQKTDHRHPSCNVSVALDLAHALCRTEYLFHTHTDVFPRRRDLLEWMLKQTSPRDPVAGWRMSPRTSGPWHECVSHTATMIHHPTFRQLGLSWSLDAYLHAKPDEAELRGGWPDTESGLWWTMQQAGIEPKILGDEPNHTRQVTEWHDHARSYTCTQPHDTEERRRARADMEAAAIEARKRLGEWLWVG